MTLDRNLDSTEEIGLHFTLALEKVIKDSYFIICHDKFK